MQFVLMCCFDEQRWGNLPEAQRQKIMEDYGKFEQGIVNSGHFLATAKLQASAAAATVRENNGRRVATDGPFAETKEQLGGIHLIECKDLDEAIAIAGRIPTLPAGGAIEVRPVMRLSQK
jgi:hypothetical protein